MVSATIPTRFPLPSDSVVVSLTQSKLWMLWFDIKINVLDKL